jgi:hypothetical protein
MREWFNDPANMAYSLLTALALIALVRLPRAISWVVRMISPLVGRASGAIQIGRFRQSAASVAVMAGGGVAGTLVPAASSSEPRVIASAPAAIPCVRGTSALMNPPGLPESLRYMRETSPDTPYLVPLGWHKAVEGPDLAHTTFVGETNNILITGQADSGKDSLVWWIFLSLAQQHTPKQVQFCFFDGKGLDWDAWENKAHTWGLATRTQDIPELMRRLSAERERRREIMRGKASKWESYKGDDLPLLVVFISELALLEVALKEEAVRMRALPQKERPIGWTPLDLETWLSAETTSGRAFGLRYVIGTQSVSGMRTLWRSQTSLYMAAANPDPDLVEPNTNWTAKRLATVGAVPPFKIPTGPEGAGVFTIVSGGQAVTARATYLDEAQRYAALADLPDARPSGVDTLSTLLSQAIGPNKVAEVVPAPAPVVPAPVEPAKSEEKPVQNFAAAEESFAASESDFAIFNLRYSPAEIAVIAAQLAQGAKKSKVVPKMPKYDSRRHREFAAYYEMLYSAITEQDITIPKATATPAQPEATGSAEGVVNS